MIRIGQGYDIHRFIAGRPLVLGGYELKDAPRGLLGHSDADALVHAVIDAILGALALGDIGKWFPDTDEEWRGASGKKLMDHVLLALQTSGWRIVNVDSTVITQAPKLSPHIFEIRSSLAGLLKINVENVSVKAKTKERLDAVGAGEALEAQAVVLMER